MKQLFLFAATVTLNLIFITTFAQNCKPDYSQLDKIEKKQIDAWSCELYETGFAASMVNTSQAFITLTLARIGDINFVQVQIKKYEGSDVNAILESTLRGAKGTEFDFGIKNGDPLKFVATKANNQTKREGITGKLVTTVTLSSEIKSEDLQSIKETLTIKVIDALRVNLGDEIVLTVKEKKGNKMKEKAICFFNYLEGKGLLKSGNVTEEVKTKPQNNDNKNVETPSAQKIENLTTQKKEDNISNTEETDNTLPVFAQEVSKEYDRIGKFGKGGVALVWKNKLVGMINTSGKELVKPEYEKIGSFSSDNLAFTTKEGKIGMINLEGKVIVQNMYESIGPFKESHAITKMNGLYGMINKQGKVLIENKYEKIKVGKYGDIRAEKDGQEILLDIKD